MEFDCRPGAIAQSLALREPKYQETAAYCHFGREPVTKKLALILGECCGERTASSNLAMRHKSIQVQVNVPKNEQKSFCSCVCLTHISIGVEHYS